jgi:hypothetical protein
MTLVKLERDVRILKIYAAMVTVVAAVSGAAAFKFADHKQKFEEIDVERINIVEKDGKLKLVISNNERQHPGALDGKTIPRHGARGPGLLFFNERGDECGGLTFDGNQKEGHTEAASLTFDQFRQDQTVGLQYIEENGERFAGLRVWDRPESSLWETVEKLEAIRKMSDGPEKTAALKRLREAEGRGEFGATRIVVGKGRDKAAMIMLADAKGKPRIRLAVDAIGNPRLEFLDEAGKVTCRLPDDRNKTR